VAQGLGEPDDELLRGRRAVAMLKRALDTVAAGWNELTDEFGRDSHHGDLRKGAYLRRRADYRSQLRQRSTSQDLHQTKGLGTG